MNFSWVPFYRELAGKVLEFEDKQDELLAVLWDMKDDSLPSVPLQDNQPDGSKRPLEVIDPFTFLAILARVETPRAIQICEWLKKRWEFTSAIPTNFEGRATIQARGGNSWFFGSVESGRQPEDVGRLWKLAEQAYSKSLDDIDFELLKTCVTQNNLSLRKLTLGLSWLSPGGFLPLGGAMLTYLKSRDVQFDTRAILQKDANAYRELMQNVQKLDANFMTLTAEAAKIKSNEPSEETELEFSTLQTYTPSSPMTSLNQILYGPPGTGKTYSSISRAVSLIDGSSPENRDDCQRRFHELRGLGQIGFVTFHQSFSYEEFVEGLRPVITDKVGEVRYEIRQGILKKMAKQAQEDRIQSPLLPLLQTLIASNTRDSSEEEGSTHKLLKNLRFTPNGIMSDGLDGERYASIADLESVYVLEKETRLRIADLSKIELSKNSDHSLLISTIRSLKRIANNNSVEISLEEKTSPKNFVLIIDEINRGNISKVFGELITLLEDDKRIGEPNELRVTLPTSGETFALPPNLYILGTMNTADRSLAQLDVALRRRFEFEELAPRPELCDKLDDLPEVLTALNERLEWALDREHRLGHAYFMDVHSEAMFNARFRSKVVPLLIEYFPHDFVTLRAVLGETSDGFLRTLTRPEGFRGGGVKYRWWFETQAEKTFSAFEQLKTNFGI